MRISSALAMSAIVTFGAGSAAVAQTASAPVTAPAAMQNGTPLSPSGQQALTMATKNYFRAIHQLGPNKLASFEGIVAPDYHLVLPNGTTWDSSRVISWATANTLNSSGLVESVNITSAQSSGDTVIATVSAAGSVLDSTNTDLESYRSGSSTHTMTWKRTGGTWQLVEDHITSSTQSPNNGNNT